MKASSEIIDAIKVFEGCRFVAYRCTSGVLTIGYGHTKGVKVGQRCSIEQAEEFLLSDVNEVVKQVNSVIKSKLYQNRFDAIVDFVFNIGIGKFSTSTLLKKLNANPDDKTIPDEFRRWVYSGGKVVKGLVKRREWEAKLYARK